MVKPGGRPWATASAPFQVVPDQDRGRVEVVCGEGRRAEAVAALERVLAAAGLAGTVSAGPSGAVLVIRSASVRGRQSDTSLAARETRRELGISLVGRAAHRVA